MRLFRPLVAATFALGLVAGFTVTGVQPAGAVSCYGDYCSGQDPQASGCSADAVTVGWGHLEATDIYVELRWSPTCKTNWARGSGSINGTQQIYAVQDTGYTQYRSGSNPWSLMIYSPVHAVQARLSYGPAYIATPYV